MSHRSTEAFSTPACFLVCCFLYGAAAASEPWSFPGAAFAKVTLGAQTSTHVWTFTTDDPGGIQLFYENPLQREREKIVVAPKWGLGNKSDRGGSGPKDFREG